MSRRRLALVTGGCRRLGGAIAVGLAEAGWDLALHANGDAEPSADVAAAIAHAGVRSTVVVADFTDVAAVESLLPTVVAAWGRAPDLLVNNASLFGQDRLKDTTGSAMTAHYAVNCVAPALLIQHFAKLSSSTADGQRSVVNIVDQRIARPHDDQFAYTMSKIAMAGLTEIAARALYPAVRVNAVAPGLTLPTSDYTADQLDRLRAMMPLSRLPVPAEVAAAVVYLADAGAITGQTLFVDAGAHFCDWDSDFVRLGSAAVTTAAVA